jgi:hypothetical protein
MIIHNPILTGSFTVNGVDVLSITSSAANITSLNAATASLNTFSASMLTFTASAATTGSNTFVGNQVVTGSLTVTGSITTPGTLTAQTLVVQTITSSVDFVTGSTRFGSVIGNTHIFTGSVSITGSLALVGNITSNGTAVVLGSGTTNYLPKFTGTSTIGNSQIIDNGTSVSIGSTALSQKFIVVGGNGNQMVLDNTGQRFTQLNFNNNGTQRSYLAIDNTNNLFEIYGSAGYSLSFGADGGQKMLLNASGNLGLGVTPSAWGSIFSGGVFQVKNSSLLAYNNNTYLSTNAYFTNSGDNYIGNGFASRYIQITGQHVWESATNNTSGADAVLTLVERMRITSAGNVLIGNPSGVSLNGLVNNLSVSSTTYNLFDISRFSDNAFGPNFYLVKSRNASIGGNTIVINGDNLGNIAWLGANGTGFTDAAGIRAEVDGTPGASNDMPGRLVFSTTADGAGSVTERMRITSAGFTKISNNGTYISSTGNFHEISTTLTNNNAVYITNTASSNPYGPYISFPNASPNDTTRYFFSCGDSTTDRFTARSNGGLANYSANNVNLASDRRLKKDIVILSTEWDKLKQIQIVNYRYKDSNDETALYGAIAQQVQEIYPELVIVTREATETEPEYYGLREQPFQWLTTKVLQEAMAKIEQLEAEIDELKNK